MEITVNIKGLDKLAEAVTLLAKANATDIKMNGAGIAAAIQVPASGQNAGVQQEKQPEQGPVVPVTQPEALPQGNQESGTPQNTAPAAVPTAPVTQTYTMEQIGVAMAGLMDAGKVQEVQQIMAQFGVQTIMEIPQERYPELVQLMKNAGAVI